MEAEPQPRRVGLGPRAWLALALAVASSGCASAPWKKGNPWGPEAVAARAAHRVAPVPDDPRLAAWDAWAVRNLRDGDLAFRMGAGRAALGLFPFSKFFAAVTASRFSHAGLVAIEDGVAVVYDTGPDGPQRMPFSAWTLEAAGAIAVKRPKPEHRQRIPQALAFCRDVYRRQVPFDYGFTLGDDRLYCVELVERSYRRAGLGLSAPVRIDHLPRYGDFPKTVRLIRLLTPIEPHQEAHVIGNERFGIWASPDLELVYDAPDARRPYAERARR